MRLLGIALVALGLVAPSEARAQPGDRPRLRWDAPVGCPDAAWVAGELDALLESADGRGRGAAVDGRIIVGSQGYALALEIEVEGRTESRTAESEDCRLLASAAVLLVAITVDAIAASQTIAERSEATTAAVGSGPPDVEPGSSLSIRPPERIPVSAQPQPTPRAAPANEPASTRWRHGVEGGVGGGLGVALVPAITGGLEAQLGWRYGPVRVRALGFHWFGRARRAEDGNGVFAALSGAGLRGCYALPAGRLELPFCLGADAAALYGRGIGADVDSRSPADLWVALTAGVGGELLLGPRFALRARAELVATVRRPALHLDRPEGQNEVFRAAPVGFRLVLGASVRSR